MATKPARGRRRSSSRQKNPLLKLLGHRKAIVAPSILSADFSQLKTEISRAKRAGCNWIHVDIMDGHFVPNLTIGPPVVASIKKHFKTLLFDTHLMIEDPLKFAGDFRNAGANNITIHYEAAGEESPKIIRKIKRLGATTGLSIKPKTPITAIEHLLDKVNLILVMTVEPGFGGQELISSTLSKVRSLDLIRQERNLDFLIQVDGGINPKTTPVTVAAGAQVLVAGNSVFGDGRVAENISALNKGIRSVR